MGRKPVLLLGAAAAIAVALVVAMRLAPAADEPVIPAAPAAATGSNLESAGLCPWREPQEDLHRFFPDADRYEQRLLILSDLRLEITQKLGPNGLMDANGIYCYRVFRQAA